MLAALPTVLGALAWNPTVRGILFPGLMLIILAGSSYMLLATNVGNRLGILIAGAGFFGWIFIMSFAWMIYGIGMQGRPAQWKVREHLVGSTETAQYEPATNLDDGWKVILEGVPIRGDAQSVADGYLAPAADSGAPRVFGLPSDYVFLTKAYDRGGDNQLFTLGNHEFFFRHSPHWFVVQVQPSAKVPAVGADGQPKLNEAGEPTLVNKLVNGKPVADATQPITSVVLLRDLGSRRQPSFVWALCSGILFFVCCRSLHKRDKAIMAHVKANPGLARA